VISPVGGFSPSDEDSGGDGAPGIPGPDAPARHPAGLASLFFTEMWERFSYYGMRALLVLFMVDAVRGGLGLSDRVATAIYGIYTGAVYLMSLPGGWVGDRLLGRQGAVWNGGVLILLGHLLLAVPRPLTFFPGLALVVAGSGLLKPNMSALVAELYPEGGARRDAGFTIFYMGVNLGAALGPFVCGALGERWNWHYGFGAASVGMALGLVQFRLSRGRLGGAGQRPANPLPPGWQRRAAPIAVRAAAGLLLLGLLVWWFRPGAVVIARCMTTVILVVGALFYGRLFAPGCLARGERRGVWMILILLVASALFWAGFEQAGSSFNLFAGRYTDRVVALPGWLGGPREIPAGWFQSLGAVFVILFAPVFAALWVRLGRRGLNPPTSVKFGLGLLSLASGFVIMAGAAVVVAGGGKAAPVWLMATYLVHTFGELCLSPVGLSSVSQLAPARLVGRLLGVWYLATALGNVVAGLLAGSFEPGSPGTWPAVYARILVPPVLAGIALIALARPLQRWLRRG